MGSRVAMRSVNTWVSSTERRLPNNWSPPRRCSSQVSTAWLILVRLSGSKSWGITLRTTSSPTSFRPISSPTGFSPREWTTRLRMFRTPWMKLREEKKLYRASERKPSTEEKTSSWFLLCSVARGVLMISPSRASIFCSSLFWNSSVASWRRTASSVRSSRETIWPMLSAS